MVDKEFVMPWIQRADNDISTARYLTENMRPLPIEIGLVREPCWFPHKSRKILRILLF